MCECPEIEDLYFSSIFREPNLTKAENSCYMKTMTKLLLDKKIQFFFLVAGKTLNHRLWKRIYTSEICI